MQLMHLLKGKLHHARITHCQVEYQGSIGISRDLMKTAGITEGEQVHVWAVDHEARIVTYAIPDDDGGVVALKGGAARHFQVGDRVVIAAFVLSDRPVKPKVAVLNKHNEIESGIRKKKKGRK
jgi:aspartate 1-decarboxylase